MKIIITLLVLLFMMPVNGEEVSEEQIKEWQKINDSMPINTYRFVGNHIVCRSDTPDEFACHKIGALKVGDKFTPTSEPWKKMPQTDGGIIEVYPIIANAEYNAYWVIGHKDEVITSLQLTGNYPHEELQFSTIQLTDNKDKVRRVLGPRFKESKIEEINGVMWDYYPFKITLEFVDEKVYSIRLSK